jgi:hypothetical protein
MGEGLPCGVCFVTPQGEFPPAKGEEGFVKIYILKERRK